MKYVLRNIRTGKFYQSYDRGVIYCSEAELHKQINSARKFDYEMATEFKSLLEALGIYFEIVNYNDLF